MYHHISGGQRTAYLFIFRFFLKFCGYIYVFEHVCEKYLQNPKEGVRSPGAEQNWELNAGLLPEHKALLTTQSSLRPQNVYF